MPPTRIGLDLRLWTGQAWVHRFDNERVCDRAQVCLEAKNFFPRNQGQYFISGQGLIGAQIVANGISKPNYGLGQSPDDPGDTIENPPGTRFMFLI